MNPVELFPVRINDRTVKAKEMPQGVANISGGYMPVQDSALLPAADTAFARTVRLHESGHAIYSRDTRFVANDYLSQALEDVKIHQLLRTVGSVRRDELSVAITDVRSVARRMGSALDRACQAVQLLRAASILRKPNSSTLGTARLVRTANKFHKQGIDLVDAILHEVTVGNMAAARVLASKLFTGKDAEESPAPAPAMPALSADDTEETETSETLDEAPEESSEASKPKPQPKERDSEERDSLKGPLELPRKFAVLPDSREETIPEEISKPTKDARDYVPALTIKAETIHRLETSRRADEDGTLSVITGDDGKPLTVRRKVGRKIVKVEIPYPKMFVHALSPNASRKVKGHGRNTYRSVSQGMKIRTNRLALNAVSPNGGRLFESKHLGGTVLIDASGSMNISDAILYEIAEKIPAGKVAYYSGCQDEWWEGTRVEHSWLGHLVIYAQNGRIRRDSGVLPQRSGGNLVDYQALLWLLKQAGPRYLMTDVVFTGPLANRAKKLLAYAEQQKKIVRFHSMAALMQMIRGKDGGR